ncbi:IFT1B protein, partial [Polyodon spathula]|nr:IFT1B protein [Polyodon spathula]
MDNSLKTKLLQLECHFTWDFKKEDTSIADLEERLHEEIQFSQKKYKGSSYNYLAYVKHMQGLNKEALTFLEQAEEITRKDHGDEFEKLVIVTYGNFAWVYYHMGELTKTQSYLEKLEDICKKFPNKASRYSVLLPAVYGEKGLSFLKVCAKYYDRAKECIEKALAEEPDEKEWNTGYAIALYRLERMEQDNITVKSSAALKQLTCAQKLDPENPIIIAFLALKLQQSKQGAIKHFKEGLQIQYPSLEHKRCYDKLKEISRRRIEWNPKDGGTLWFIHQMKDRKLQAIEYCEKALLCDHGNEEYLSALCDLHLSLNKND